VKAEQYAEEARRLLSCMEQAQRLTRATEQELRGGRLGANEHDALVQTYRKASEHAAARLARLRAKASRAAAHAGAQLQRTLAAQQAAVRKSASPEKYGERITRLREAIAGCNRVVSAPNAAALGGFLDWPLERYLSPPSPYTSGEFAPTRANFLLAGVTLVLLLAAVVLTYTVTRSSGGVQIDAHFQELPQPRVRVFFTNKHPESVALYVGGAETAARPAEAIHAYRVEVYVDEHASDGAQGYRLVADTAAAWLHEGEDFSRRGYLLVQPYAQVDLALPIQALRESGLTVNTVRLLITGPGGNVAASYVFPL
jgi:hypothetical protein